VLFWRGEAEFVAEFPHERVVHPLPHAYGAIALHVGMPADRTGASAGPANIPAKQQEVHDFLDRRDGVFVLRQARRQQQITLFTFIAISAAAPICSLVTALAGLLSIFLACGLDPSVPA